jgi:hypothetical protein
MGVEAGQAEGLKRARVLPAFPTQFGAPEVDEVMQRRQRQSSGCAQLNQRNQPRGHVLKQVAMLECVGRFDANIRRIAAHGFLDAVGMMPVGGADPGRQ